MQKNLWIRKKDVPLQSFQTKVVLTREHSSVGLEHLPYKQRVGGSTPSAPTKVFQNFLKDFFLLVLTNFFFFISKKDIFVVVWVNDRYFTHGPLVRDKGLLWKSHEIRCTSPGCRHRIICAYV